MSIAVDLNIDGLFLTLNNLFDFLGQASGGLSQQGTNVGKVAGIVIILLAIGIVLGLIWKGVRGAVSVGGRYV